MTHLILTPGVSQKFVINTSLKLKPGCVLHVYKAWACLVPHVSAMAHRNYSMAFKLRAIAAMKGASRLLLSYCHCLFLSRTRRTAFLKSATAFLYNFLQPVLAFTEVSCLVDIVTPETNASLDLTPVLKTLLGNRHLGVYLRIYGLTMQ